MRDRILQLLTKENVSATKFADFIGVQRSSISHLLSGRNKPGFDFIEKTLLKYPNINPEWFILGKGPMYKSIITENDEKIVTKTTSSKDIQPDLFSFRKDSDKKVHISMNNETVEANKKINMVTNVNNTFIERIVIFYSDKSFLEYKPQ